MSPRGVNPSIRGVFPPTSGKVVKATSRRPSEPFFDVSRLFSLDYGMPALGDHHDLLEPLDLGEPAGFPDHRHGAHPVDNNDDDDVIIVKETSRLLSPPTSPCQDLSSSSSSSSSATPAAASAAGSLAAQPPLGALFLTPPLTPDGSSPLQRDENGGGDLLEDGSIELDCFSPENIAHFADHRKQQHQEEGGGKLTEAERVNLQAVRHLVETYGDIATSLDKHGFSFVHHAVREGFLTVLRFFRQSAFASCLHLLDACGNNSLQIAAMADRPEIASFLIEAGVSASHRNHDDHNALRIACQHKNERVLALLCGKFPALLNERDEQGRTLLHYACAAGHRETVAILIRAGAVPFLKDLTGTNALHASVMLGSPEEVLELLIEDRSILETTDRLYRNPLHWACSVGNLAAVRFLVKSGARLEQRDKKGRTPFLLACFSGHSEVAQFLLLKKAVRDVEDYEGHTAKFP